MPNNPTSTHVSEPGSSMIETSANRFNSQAAFEDHVLSSLRQVETYHDFLFTDVPEDWGEAIFRLVDKEIPSR
jgi:hypothetical protein